MIERRKGVMPLRTQRSDTTGRGFASVNDLPPRREARSPEKIIDRAAFCGIAEGVGTKGVPEISPSTPARAEQRAG